MTTPAKKKAAKKAGAVKPAAPASSEAVDKFSDELLAEVDLDEVPPIREFHQLDRRRRAHLTRQLSELLPGLARYERMVTLDDKASDQEKTNVAADAMEFLADIEDLLATIAVDSDAVRRWAQDAGDVELIAVFAQFARSMNSGEADSSSS